MRQLPIVKTIILCQAVILLLLGSIGNLSLLNLAVNLSLTALFALISWFAVFAAIDYSESKNFGHAVKLGLIFTVIWAAIGTGLEFVYNFALSYDFELLYYVLYALEITLRVLSAMFFAAHFRADKEPKNKVALVGAIAAFVVMGVVVAAVLHFIPKPDYDSLFNSGSMSFFDSITGPEFVDQRYVINDKVLIIYYAVEGILLSLYYKVDIKLEDC